MNAARFCSALLPALLMLSGAINVEAATPRDAGDQALRQAQQMLQRLAREKSLLEKENQRLAEELKKAQAELDGTRSKLSQSEQQGDQMRERNSALVGRVRDDSERLGNLQETYRNEIGVARADIRLLRNAVVERESWIADCRSKNEGLYKANTDLLQAYKNKGVWDALSQREPVTGIASVKVENLVQEYQYRLEDLHTTKPEMSAVDQDTDAAR